MSTKIRILVAIIGILVWTASAIAQEEAKKADEKETEKVELKLADEPEEVIFERLVGLYFEGRGGVFFTLGGARGYSNGEPFFGFELGYDFTERFSAQLAYASGYQAGNPIMCPSADLCPTSNAAKVCSGANCSDYHLDFGMTFFNVSGDFDIWYGKRWALETRLGAGVVMINPSAKPDQAGIDFDVFGGLRYEYYTLLKHFTVGGEVDFYYVLPTGIPSMSVSLQILYNF
jgi:hypothetical protein